MRRARRHNNELQVPGNNSDEVPANDYDKVAAGRNDTPRFPWYKELYNIQRATAWQPLPAVLLIMPGVDI